ncbi:hypothetical protein CVT24_009452 [Panaeolus cyanescens]|uniref:Nephrocystin 3-like N-terminal domain-containing protein n=1 Tax=Panaeolus cyanescens TaxID=181874 RepID=A0A409WCG3_9AGAR|nr:hypothetical protein CVT24_009452 [Panaeolus cyanescens]
MATSDSNASALEPTRECPPSPHPMQRPPPTRMIVSHLTQNVTNIHNNSTPVPQGDILRLSDHACTEAYENKSDQFDELKCYPGTRKVLLDRLDTWLSAPLNNRRAIMWLDGPMGSGKSAAARSIAERMSLKDRLLGMFIFRRGEGGRGNATQFVTTLAYQMVSSIPGIRPLVAQQIALDPSIFRQSISHQLDVLVIEPLRRLRQTSGIDVTSLANVIIVDGLDECDDEKEGRENIQTSILNMLYRLTLNAEILPFAILVASRPEIHLKSWFRQNAHDNVTCRTTLDSSYKPHEDIQFFVTQSFLKLQETHPLRHHLPPSWPLEPEECHLTTKPTEDDIAKCKVVKDIVTWSSGQFIFPAVSMKFIASPRYLPHQRLEYIMQPTSYDTTDPNNPNTIVDNLYHQVLGATSDHEVTLKVLIYNSLGIHRRDLPLMRVLSVLQLSSAEFDHCIEQLESLASCGSTSHSFLRFYHTSLQIFLQDEKQSKQWCIQHPQRILDVATQASKLFREETYAGAQYSYLRIFIKALERVPVSMRSKPQNGNITEYNIFKQCVIQFCDFSSSPYHNPIMRFLTQMPLIVLLQTTFHGLRSIVLHSNDPDFSRINGKSPFNFHRYLQNIATLIKPDLDCHLSSPRAFAQFMLCLCDRPLSRISLPGGIHGARYNHNLRQIWDIGSEDDTCPALCLRETLSLFSIPSWDFLEESLLIIIGALGQPGFMSLPYFQIKLSTIHMLHFQIKVKAKIHIPQLGMRTQEAKASSLIEQYVLHYLK